MKQLLRLSLLLCFSSLFIVLSGQQTGALTGTGFCLADIYNTGAGLGGALTKTNLAFGVQKSNILADLSLARGEALSSAVLDNSSSFIDQATTAVNANNQPLAVAATISALRYLQGQLVNGHSWVWPQGLGPRGGLADIYNVGAALEDARSAAAIDLAGQQANIIAALNLAEQEALSSGVFSQVIALIAPAKQAAQSLSPNTANVVASVHSSFQGQLQALNGLSVCWRY